MGFTSAGLPLGVTFSFLISSPMVDLGSLLLLMSIFGWKIAVLYVLFGLVVAVVGGTLIEKMGLENQVEDFIRHGSAIQADEASLTRRDRLSYAFGQMTATAKKVFPYVVAGVGLGAIIHNWIPTSFIVQLLGDGNPFGVLLATVAGVPMYADIFGTIPIAEALLQKGAAIGGCAVVYDGGHHPIAAVDDLAAQSDEAKAAWHLCADLYPGYFTGGVSV